ncbi:RNA polymerase sigma factor [Cellulomonas fimi]|uniref:RNA polymerase sigma factor n=1 Tax=Cellulomonas fimi TaxID=1708 RepID=A0A7Y0QHN8_CELFI|nr:sigma-70 family RNA polymerase sigma factor [Cellulomonas fimi]NMR20084.1 sigma-70 family RNA polymerase sigma factor [Cellulomonas fimi]
MSPAPDGSTGGDAGWQALLVTQARGGDESAFEALVRLHQDRAYHVALRMTGDPQDAQDVIQDALLQAWKNLGGYRGDSGFGTWLIRIVINRCHNLRRGHRLTTTLPDQDRTSTAAGPEAEAVAGQRRDATVAAVLACGFRRSKAVGRAW